MKTCKTTGLALIVLLITTILFTACPNTAGVKPADSAGGGGGGSGGNTPATPEYTVNFAVDGGNGTLTAAVDGKPINTGAKVQEGKTVKFTAAPNAGYAVEQWTNGGAVIAEAGANKTYSHTVTENADIKVKFKEILLDTAVLTLSPDKKDITVKVITADGSPVTVEGCTETTLPSGTGTVLHAQGTRVTLKGKITELDCYNNPLTALDVQGLSALQTLTCYNNELTALNVQGCIALQWLNCSGNKLKALDVQGLTALQWLGCEYNQLTALDVQGLSALQTLDCSDNKLTALNVQGLSALQELDCGINQLTALNVQGCIALQWLNCSGNKLKALDVQGLTALQRLDCSGNQLTALNVQGCIALKVLYCSGNKLNAAAFERLFTGLPQREESDDAMCILYREEAGEENHNNFSSPSGLATAFNNAKTVKKWKMYKENASGKVFEI